MEVWKFYFEELKFNQIIHESDVPTSFGQKLAKKVYFFKRWKKFVKVGLHSM